MYTFEDKANRKICLVPEVTAQLQELVSENYFQNKYPQKLFYIQRCYRYENTQAGRYREFTQMGVEILTNKPSLAPTYKQECVSLMTQCLESFGIKAQVDTNCVRGLSYYTDLGFEARVEELGAQKQVAGGGVYPEGCGFAFGLDRLVLAVEKQNELK